ncbi:hypothetical protein ACHAPI_002912 [Fusarium lateritium]
MLSSGKKVETVTENLEADITDGNDCSQSTQVDTPQRTRSQRRNRMVVQESDDDDAVDRPEAAANEEDDDTFRP